MKEIGRKYEGYDCDISVGCELKIIYRAIEEFFLSISGYTDVNIEFDLKMRELEVIYRDGEEQIRIPLSQLSRGFKDSILVIADIAIRMAVLNPHLQDNVLIETDGVVFIDEVELHLHPTVQQKIIKQLMKTFPRVQFVVSTYAPAVINSIQSNNLRILSKYQVLEVSQQIYGSDINSIMIDIMGTSIRPAAVSDLFNQFYEKLDEGSFAEAEIILDKIDMIRGSHDSELSGCRVKLRLERMRRGKSIEFD